MILILHVAMSLFVAFLIVMRIRAGSKIKRLAQRNDDQCLTFQAERQALKREIGDGCREVANWAKCARERGDQLALAERQTQTVREELAEIKRTMNPETVNVQKQQIMALTALHDADRELIDRAKVEVVREHQKRERVEWELKLLQGSLGPGMRPFGAETHGDMKEPQQ